MGNTPNTFGKPVFGQTPTQTVVDLQAGSDFADTFAHVRVGTSTQRGALTGGQMRAGMEFRETDTNLRFVRNGANSGWERLGAGPARHDGVSGGSGGAGGASFPSAAVDLPYGLLIKTGVLVASTAVSFGNEYFPVVTFAAAFPTGVLSVQLTPLLGGSGITKASGTLSLDNATTTQFRALVADSPNPWVRGFSWVALGY